MKIFIHNSLIFPSSFITVPTHPLLTDFWHDPYSNTAFTTIKARLPQAEFPNCFTRIVRSQNFNYIRFAWSKIN
jgi:hypothetical protein